MQGFMAWLFVLLVETNDVLMLLTTIYLALIQTIRDNPVAYINKY